MTRFPQLLSLVLAGALLNGCATIRPGQGAVRFTPLHRNAPTKVVGPGLYGDGLFRHYNIYDLHWMTTLESAEIQTQDKLHMSIAASITYRIRESSLAEVDRVLGKSFYASTVKPILLTAIRTEFAKYEHDRVVPEAATLQDKIAVAAREALAPLGIEVSRVVLDDIDYPDAIADSIAQQMATYQEIENQAAELELATRRARVAEEKALAVARVQLVTAEAALEVARREAEVLAVRSEAQAVANVAESRGLTKAVLRLRSIEAAEALARSPNTKVYVMPTGEDGLPYLLHDR